MKVIIYLALGIVALSLVVGGIHRTEAANVRNCAVYGLQPDCIHPLK